MHKRTYRKDFHYPDNQHGVITDLEPDILGVPFVAEGLSHFRQILYL